MQLNRCDWVTNEQIYLDYHDNEWGVPLHDSQKLFEFLCLEGMQAGLSWITILKKRASYRRLFANFDPKIIATFDDTKVQELMQDKSIIRNRLKINAIVTNAKAYLQMQDNGIKFSEFIWGFVNHKTIKHNIVASSDIPEPIPQAHNMAKQLKKLGFKFVGPTICYAFMEACGLVDDHIENCFKAN